jgi:protein O-mannosyl-transferase
VTYYLYVQHLLWPFDLHVPYVLPAHWSKAIVCSAFAMAIGACFLVKRCWKSHGYIYLGILLFFGTLAPVVGVIRIGEHFMADRYLYLPQIGLFIVIVFGAAHLFGKRLWSPIGLTTVGALWAGLLITTLQLAPEWASSIRLFERTARVAPMSYTSHHLLSLALLRDKQYERALEVISCGLKVSPTNSHLRTARGVVLHERGEHSEALKGFNDVLASSPEHPGALVQAAWIQATSPDASLRNGTNAIERLEKVARAKGDAPGVLAALGAAYAENGQYDKANEYLRRGLANSRFYTDSAVRSDILRYLKIVRSRQPIRD